MAIRDSSGTVLTKSALEALATENPAAETTYTMDETVYRDQPFPGEKDYANGGKARTVQFVAGQVVSQSQIDALYAAATATGISPASGAAAGNTVVTITGTHLDGVTDVKVGGVSLTNLEIVSPTKIKGKTGAHSAGAVAVAITDDSGTVNMTGTPYTYV